MKTESMLERQAESLDKLELHAALDDPVLNSVNFLNEIIDHYPDAISFAPGAPYMGFYDDFDLAQCIDRFIRYLEEEKGYSQSRSRRLLYQYGPSKGLINDLIAQALYKDEGINVKHSDIIVTVGCQEAILLSIRALCRSDRDLLALTNPCYVGASGAAKILDVKLAQVKEIENGINLDFLRDQCQTERDRGRKIKALYLAPNFSNPSGGYYDLSMRQQLLDLASEQDFYILEDNAYGFTALNDHVLPCLKSLDLKKRVIYLGTCAKMCLPGVRVGFAVADQPVFHTHRELSSLADELALIKNMISVNTSPICQAIVGGMLLNNDISFKTLSKEKSKFYQKNLIHLLNCLQRKFSNNALANDKYLKGVSWNKPQGGLFVRMRLPIPVDKDLLCHSAKYFGVLWTPMSEFSFDGETCSNEIRLACSYLTRDQIEEGVHRLALFLSDVL